MAVRSAARRILPPPVFQEAARPQLGESGGSQGRLQDDELVIDFSFRRKPAQGVTLSLLDRKSSL